MTLHFIVDRLHVSLSDRQVIKTIRRYMKRIVLTKNGRKDVYKIALKRHQYNQSIVTDFNL